MWYSQGLEPLAFRDMCQGPLCNQGCPETFELGSLTSNNWPTWSKIFIAGLIVGIGVAAMIMKAIFVLWLLWIEKNQKQYLTSLEGNFIGEDHSKLQVCYRYLCVGRGSLVVSATLSSPYHSKRESFVVHRCVYSGQWQSNLFGLSFRTPQ